MPATESVDKPRSVRPRRFLAGTLIVLGGVFLFAAPESFGGLVLVVLGIGVEIAGIALEHKR